ncbi:hypothetical protein [Desulfosporosinus sp. OT]|uniref:hypothetical protein n=1 Tax=Desulfosporosinus sp. OT TaxID=913865 RepID=UPI0002239D9F|nr:hypothetical protein [Desulfosporosinus sp. OT]EGW36014.1 hypothetical protein DOT_6122 [Desulfosporosinus sp. OT]
MDADKFLDTLIKATKEETLHWVKVPDRMQERISDVTAGIVGAYFIDRDQSKVVVYQYKYVDTDEGTEGVSIHISFTDADFRVKYELNGSDFGPNKEAALFRLYKLIQRKANNIDKVMEEFINDFSDKPPF